MRWLVGKTDVERVAVGLAVDGDGANAEFRQAFSMRSAISPRWQSVLYEHSGPYPSRTEKRAAQTRQLAVGHKHLTISPVTSDSICSSASWLR